MPKGLRTDQAPQRRERSFRRSEPPRVSEHPHRVKTGKVSGKLPKRGTK